MRIFGLWRLINVASFGVTAGRGALLEKEISGNGDIARMLQLPGWQELYQPERVTIHEILLDNALWRPDRDADVLLLGDSFSNIFSQAALGWGESAGFAEHLSRALGGRALDCIVRNSDAAFATREMLSGDLSRGIDRLAGKKVVVWEFAARELAFGDWKIIPMKLQERKPTRFFVPKANEPVLINGIVEAVSALPQPGTVPYRDRLFALHLVDLKFEDGRASDALESVVYLQSMADNILTPAARLRPGDHVRLRLRSWSDVSDEYEKINRSELDDPALQLEEPCWGNEIQ